MSANSQRLLGPGFGIVEACLEFGSVQVVAARATKAGGDGVVDGDFGFVEEGIFDGR